MNASPVTAKKDQDNAILAVDITAKGIRITYRVLLTRRRALVLKVCVSYGRRSI